MFGGLFHYLTTRIEKDDFLRRHRLGPCGTLKGRPLKPGRTDTITKRLGSRSIPSENRLFKECKVSRHSRSPFDTWQKPFLNLVANRWICSKQSVSSRRWNKSGMGGLGYGIWEMSVQSRAVLNEGMRIDLCPHMLLLY